MPLEMDVAEMMWRDLKQQIAQVSANVQQLRIQYERAGVADGIPASSLADAPLAATGGLADGVNYITLRWITDGRRPGEGAGDGTGVLAFYDTATDTWRQIDGYAAVTV